MDELYIPTGDPWATREPWVRTANWHMGDPCVIHGPAL